MSFEQQVTDAVAQHESARNRHFVDLVLHMASQETAPSKGGVHVRRFTLGPIAFVVKCAVRDGVLELVDYTTHQA